MILIATKMTATSIFRMCCFNGYSHSGRKIVRGSSDVSVHIIQMVHFKVISSVSISLSLIRIFQFLQQLSACVKFPRNGVEALQMLVIPLHQNAPSSRMNKLDAVIFTYIYFLSVNISVNSTISSRLLTGLLLLVSLIQSNVEVYPVITSLVP